MTPPVVPGSMGSVSPMVPPKAPTAKESIAAGIAEHGGTAKEEGKRQFEELRPQITAPAGSTDFFQQKLAQEEFDKQHPWGSDISTHPGALGKIGHVAAKVGNIAGDIFAGRIMENIPGTELNKKEQEESDLENLRTGQQRDIQQQQADTQAENSRSENALRTAETAEHNKNAELAGQPKTDEEKTLHDLMTGGEGGTPRINPETQKPYSYLEAYGQTKKAGEKLPEQEKPLGKSVEQLNQGLATRWQAMNPGKPLPAEFTLPPNATQKDFDRVDKLMEGTEKASNTKTQQDFTNEQKRASQQTREDAAAEKKAKEGEEWVTGEDESGKTIMVPKSQAKELGLKNLAKADNDTVNKTLAARHVEPLLYSTDPNNPGIMQMIDKLDKEGKLGPLASRWNDFMARTWGADNPDYAALRARLDLATTKLMQAHVGSRGGSFMLEHFEHLADAKKMGAANLRAGIDQEIRYVHDISQRPPKGAAPAEGGGGEKPAPKVGEVVKDHKFLGGDPHKKENWEKVKK